MPLETLQRHQLIPKSSQTLQIQFTTIHLQSFHSNPEAFPGTSQGLLGANRLLQTHPAAIWSPGKPFWAAGELLQSPPSRHLELRMVALGRPQGTPAVPGGHRVTPQAVERVWEALGRPERCWVGLVGPLVHR